MNKNLNKLVKNTIALSTGLVITFVSSSTCFASSSYTKDENVFINLNSKGDVEDVFVINQFDVKNNTQIEDFGQYKKIKNLTTSDKLKNQEGKVSFDAKKGKFYYQGDLDSKNMPWNIDIDYKLDGKKIDSSNLKGKSGFLEISIKVD
ncbi:MAG: hypothetical protein Q4B52_04850 [Tissierellia bacterium]|nr:hypothetical protein [Tissierellia bacterium]